MCECPLCVYYSKLDIIWFEKEIKMNKAILNLHMGFLKNEMNYSGLNVMYLWVLVLLNLCTNHRRSRLSQQSIWIWIARASLKSLRRPIKRIFGRRLVFFSVGLKHSQSIINSCIHDSIRGSSRIVMSSLSSYSVKNRQGRWKIPLQHCIVTGWIIPSCLLSVTCFVHWDVSEHDGCLIL